MISPVVPVHWCCTRLPGCTGLPLGLQNQHEPCTSKGDADGRERCRETNDKEHLSVHVSPSACVLRFVLQWQARCVFKLTIHQPAKLDGQLWLRLRLPCLGAPSRIFGDHARKGTIYRLCLSSCPNNTGTIATVPLGQLRSLAVSRLASRFASRYQPRNLDHVPCPWLLGSRCAPSNAHYSPCSSSSPSLSKS